MQLSNTSADTWLSVSDRPPPVSTERPGARCLCWFHTDTSDRPELGYYLGDGEVRLLSAPKEAQGHLDLERVTSWRPFSQALMERFEND